MTLTNGLVWMFREHREMFQECERLRRVVDDLERQLAAQPPAGGTTADYLSNLSDTILQDLPFENNTIPEYMWLTPGEDDRGRERGE